MNLKEKNILDLTNPQAIQLRDFLNESKIPLKYNLVHTLRDELEYYFPIGVKNEIKN